MLNTKLLILPTFLLAASLVTPTSAAVVTVYWAGTITGYTHFGGQLPAGVANGVAISGALSFETDSYDTHFSITGSHTFGDRYRYGSIASMQFNVTGSEWRISGADLSLISYVFEPKQAFDAFSDSDRNGVLLFPGYVGEFEAGFALFAESSTYPIFSDSDISTAAFDFENPTSGGGFLTTRRFDENDDIVEGYYLTFTITQSSSSPIPEPSIPIYLGAVFCAILVRRSRKPQAEQDVHGNTH
jgi:hypothetical protein